MTSRTMPIAMLTAVTLLCGTVLYTNIIQPAREHSSHEDTTPVTAEDTMNKENEKVPEVELPALDTKEDNSESVSERTDGSAKPYKADTEKNSQNDSKPEDTSKGKTIAGAYKTAGECAKAAAEKEYGATAYIVTESITDEYNTLVTVAFYDPDAQTESVRLLTYDVHSTGAEWSITNTIPSGSVECANYDIQTTEDGHMLLKPALK